MCSVIFVQYYMGVCSKLSWTLMAYIESKGRNRGNVFTPNRDQLPTVGSVPFLYITLQGEVLQDQFIPTLGCYYRVAEPLLVFSRPLPYRRRK